jgi:hypothetical protein
MFEKMKRTHVLMTVLNGLTGGMIASGVDAVSYTTQKFNAPIAVNRSFYVKYGVFTHRLWYRKIN